MRRRDFITLLSGAAAAGWPVAARARRTIAAKGVSGSGSSAPIGPPNPFLPAGVTLQAIDGESMLSPATSPAMSHTYFARNGYTYATNTSFGAQSWDDPTFFPLGDFYGIYRDQVASFSDIGFNVSISVTNDTPADFLSRNAIWGVPSILSGAPEIAMGPAVCGLHIDETDPYPIINSIDDTTQAGRFWDLTLTWAAIPAGAVLINGTATSIATALSTGFFQTPSGIRRSMGGFSVDVYWFAGSTDPFSQQVAFDILSIPMVFGSGSATPDQMARGSHYGNMIDVFRSWGNGTNAGNIGTGGSDYGSGSSAFGLGGAPSRIPLFTLIENGDGRIGGTPRLITPPEYNWAVWSSIIHGARGLDSFTAVNNHFGGFTKRIASGQSISMYDQGKSTHGLLKSLAPVLNSPFALGFASATPHGYTFPVYEQGWLNGGIETMTKLYNGGYYIFATTRNSQTVTNAAATFTIKAQAGKTIATVINEARTIPLTNGGTQFVDTFANASTVHIYRID